MIALVRHHAVVCAIGLGLAVPAWADEPLHGQVIGVVGDVITLVDARQREHQLRLAFIDAAVPGQPFADEAQSALSAMLLGRQVTAQIRGRDQDGIAVVEVVEPHGHVMNLELVRRGLAWRDYFRCTEPARPRAVPDSPVRSSAGAAGPVVPGSRGGTSGLSGTRQSAHALVAVCSCWSGWLHLAWARLFRL